MIFLVVCGRAAVDTEVCESYENRRAEQRNIQHIYTQTVTCKIYYGKLTASTRAVASRESDS